MNRSPEQQRLFEDWKRRASEADIVLEAARRGAKLKRGHGAWAYSGPCPACGGRNRFSLNTVKRIFNCRGCEKGGDVINMVMLIEGIGFKQACEAITGEPCPSGPAQPLTEEQKAQRNRQRLEAEARQQARKAQEQAYQEDTREAAQAIWDASVPIKDTLAETYLRSRGIILEQYPDVLRFHSSLPYPGKPKPYPVLVCRVDDVIGNLTAVWRIFLREDGRKADVENAKLGLGPAAGGAVRIGGVASHIAIAEGVESALGAWLLLGQKVPTWAALSTSGMIGFEVPLGVSRVTVMPDGDRPLRKRGHEYEPAIPAGRKAAQALFARLTEEGVRASVAAEPPPGSDFLDVWNASQREVA